MGITSLISNATATGARAKKALDGPFTTFQAAGTTSSGVGAATINIEVSNDETNWLVAGTINLTLGTTSTSDGFAMNASWPFARANVTAISGTGAAVSAWAGR